MTGQDGYRWAYKRTSQTEGLEWGHVLPYRAGCHGPVPIPVLGIERRASLGLCDAPRADRCPGVQAGLCPGDAMPTDPDLPGLASTDDQSEHPYWKLICMQHPGPASYAYISGSLRLGLSLDQTWLSFQQGGGFQLSSTPSHRTSARRHTWTGSPAQAGADTGVSCLAWQAWRAGLNWPLEGPSYAYFH